MKGPLPALTMHQPWATLIIAGIKPVENRGWPPSTLPPAPWHAQFRCPRHGWCEAADVTTAKTCLRCGPQDVVLQRGHTDGPFPFRLAVHAGTRFDHRGFERALHLACVAADPKDDRIGLALAMTVGSSTDPAVRDAAGFPRGVVLGTVTVTGAHPADDCERRSRGDASPAAHCSPWAEPYRWHWLLADPQPLPEPIPAKGRPRLWTFDPADLTTTGPARAGR